MEESGGKSFPPDSDGLVEAYGDWMRGRGLSAATIRFRLRVARNRLAAWGTFDQSPQTLAAYLDEHTGWTKCTYAASLRDIYRWLVETGRMDHDPTAKIRRPRQPRDRPRPLTPDESSRALEAATDDVRAYLMLGLLAGLRVHEIAKIRGEDIDEQHLRVVGKGGLLATVPTHPLLWELAQQYPRRGWWFPSYHRPGEPIRPHAVYRRTHDLFQRLGISGGTHRMRHTYGTQLARSGTQLRVVQELMRHQSLATTARYLEVSEEERSAAILGLMPGA